MIFVHRWTLMFWCSSILRNVVAINVPLVEIYVAYVVILNELYVYHWYSIFTLWYIFNVFPCIYASIFSLVTNKLTACLYHVPGELQVSLGEVVKQFLQSICFPLQGWLLQYCLIWLRMCGSTFLFNMLPKMAVSLNLFSNPDGQN